MTSPTTLTELEALERAGWDALCDGTGSEFYGRVMADDGLMVLANGSVMTRGDVVRALAESPRWTDYEIADLRLVGLGDGADGIVYRGTARREDLELVCMMSSVYVRDVRGWRLALYQQTPIMSPAG